MIKSRFVAAAAFTVALAVPSSAAAVVTGSEVTAPGDPTFRLVDLDDPGPANLTVSGTTDGTTGDVVDLVCTYDGQNSNGTLAADVAVAADGSFSATGDLGALGEQTCFLRAVPDESALNSINDFKGPRLAASTTSVDGEVVGGPNDGLVYDYDIFAAGLAGEFELASLTGGALDDGVPYGMPALDDEGGAWDEGARLFPLDDNGDGNRSQIRIDGHNAYAPDGAANLFGGSDANAGLQPTTYSQSLDTATGDLTVTESANLVRCPTDVVPPTALSCASFVATGVRWDRAMLIRDGALHARVTDTLLSADGAAHEVDVRIDNDFEESETGWSLPPFDRLGRYDGNVLEAAELPAAPFSLLAEEADDEPDGSIEAGHGSITFAAVPDQLRWTDEDVVEARYTESVPAAGSVELKHGYSQAINRSEILELSAYAEDEYAPPETTITKQPKKKVKRGKAKFKFVSSDEGSTFECKIDKKAFKACESPASYKKLKPGKHKFRVRATNQAGNVDSTAAKAKWRVEKRR